MYSWCGGECVRRQCPHELLSRLALWGLCCAAARSCREREKRMGCVYLPRVQLLLLDHACKNPPLRLVCNTPLSFLTHPPLHTPNIQEAYAANKLTVPSQHLDLWLRYSPGSYCLFYFQIFLFTFLRDTRAKTKIFIFSFRTRCDWL